jgi:hypothetical protein
MHRTIRCTQFGCENMKKCVEWRAALSSEATHSLQYYSCDRNAWTIEIGQYYTDYSTALDDMNMNMMNEISPRWRTRRIRPNRVQSHKHSRLNRSNSKHRSTENSRTLARQWEARTLAEYIPFLNRGNRYFTFFFCDSRYFTVGLEYLVIYVHMVEYFFL